MKFSRFIAMTLFVVAGLFPVMASAQLSLKQKIAEQEQHMQGEVQKYQASCTNHNIKVSMNWSNMTEADFATDTYFNPHGLCAVALNAIAYLCENDMGKASVMNNIHELRCNFKQQRGVSLSGGVLTYNIDPGVDHSMEYVREYLQQNLQ